MRSRASDPTRRLRLAVGRLPENTKRAMLRGIDTNRIIVGAYVDPGSGGICPMLAAHRNGGRTDVASFARAWDEYTGASRPRRASRREVRTLRALITDSLDLDTSIEHASITELAAQIRAEREAFRCAEINRAPNEFTSAEGAAPTGSPEAPAATRPSAPRAEPLTPEEPDDEPIRVRRRLPGGERAAALRLRATWAWGAGPDEIKDLLTAAEEQLAADRDHELLGDAAERLSSPTPE